MDERPNLAELQEQVRTNNWHELGLQLTLEENDLVAISTQYRGSVVDCRREMFRQWLDNTSNPTRKQLLAALKKRAVSEIYMAKKYEEYIFELSTKHDDGIVGMLIITIYGYNLVGE